MHAPRRCLTRHRIDGALAVRVCSRQLPAILGTLLGLSAQCAIANTLTVTTCVDDASDTGSLRSVIAGAQAGDEIDLSTLTCSTISLAHGAIINHASSITLKGPATSTLTIDGNLADRVLVHSSTGTMTLRYLTITHGLYSKGEYGGGCIYALGDVYLDHSTVSRCYVYPHSTSGGGLYTHGTARLFRSTVSGNRAAQGRETIGTVGTGGGIFAGGGIYAKESIISNNTAGELGGGISDGGYAVIMASTLADNICSDGSAALFSRATVTFINSTISGNGSGLGEDSFCSTVQAASLFIYNSTVAQNSCGGQGGAELFINGNVTSYSSIIFNGTNTTSKDIVAHSITGNSNIIGTASVALPGDTITRDPQLLSLANNGGPTPTMELRSTSPAINAGDNPLNLITDQRGAGFARVSGSAPDIGAFELVDDIFGNGFQ